MMEMRGGKDTRPNVVVSKKAFANVLFHSLLISTHISKFIWTAMKFEGKSSS